MYTQMYMCSLIIIYLCNNTQMYAYTGAVFRRNSMGQTRFSRREVGSDGISFQGYEVIKGRISSQNLGILCN